MVKVEERLWCTIERETEGGGSGLSLFVMDENGMKLENDGRKCSVSFMKKKQIRRGYVVREEAEKVMVNGFGYGLENEGRRVFGKRRKKVRVFCNCQFVVSEEKWEEP